MINRTYLPSLAFLFSALFSTAVFANAAPTYCLYYPHWTNCATNKRLASLEKFIDKYKANASNYVVAFDWDGTLYDEKINVKENGVNLQRSGQSVWHIWGAKQILNQRETDLFPSFKQYTANGAIDYQAWSNNIDDMDNYMEGVYGELTETLKNGMQFTRLPQGIYDKFSQLATFEQGMTFNQFRSGVADYLQSYPAKNYAFLKMLDIVNRFGYLGFRVWIITGSNPYFVANLITDGSNSVNFIPSSIHYNILPGCQTFMQAAKNNPADLTPAGFFKACPIAGNAAVWPGHKTPFTRRYDNRNFTNSFHNPPIKMAIDHYGKWLVAQHIMMIEGKPIILYAGNSDGDYSLMKRVLDNTVKAPYGTFGIFVQPDLHGGSSLKYLLDHKCASGQCIDVEHPV